ncbi:hypothetical protein PHLGIDRAFT_122419 [Phlebiopsis gigantea 11061_1 CR5-6]|uniref:Uncharacterized protein n=1 Tax=Phlebiopsis gigantea (strain 11061_1 CR5-6) TaxID=745531 RepID=A0A0C3NDA2_PHLG1|nr:hypothetical protein PHLGIDRAFT_122419 [Phlebiopsis gigantea 11061_1 CR5-6]
MDNLVGWCVQSDAKEAGVLNVPDDSSYTVLYKDHIKTAPNPSTLNILNQSLVWILVQFTSTGNEPAGDPPSTALPAFSWVSQAISAVFITLELMVAAPRDELPFPDCTSRLSQISQRFFLSSSGTRMFIRPVIDCDDGAIDEALKQVFIGVRRNSQLQKRETLPSGFLSFLSADSIPTLTSTQVRHLCYVTLHIVASVTLDEPAMRAEWQELFSALEESLCSSEHDADPADYHRALARHPL